MTKKATKKSATKKVPAKKPATKKTRAAEHSKNAGDVEQALDEAGAHGKVGAAQVLNPAADDKAAKKAPAKKAKVDAAAETLSVSDVAREMGIDPKAARAALRAAGRGADGKRYTKVVRGSDEHTALKLFFEGNQDGVDSSPKAGA